MNKVMPLRCESVASRRGRVKNKADSEKSARCRKQRRRRIDDR